MANPMRITLRGFKELNESFKRMSEDGKFLVRNVPKDAAQILKEEIKKEAPKGGVAENIDIQPGKKGQSDTRRTVWVGPSKSAKIAMGTFKDKKTGARTTAMRYTAWLVAYWFQGMFKSPGSGRVRPGYQWKHKDAFAERAAENALSKIQSFMRQRIWSILNTGK
jgi:hypothetical protein